VWKTIPPSLGKKKRESSTASSKKDVYLPMRKRGDCNLFALLVCSFYGDFSAIRVKLENRLAANRKHNMRITRTFFCSILLTSSLLFVSCGRKSKEKLYQELLQDTAQLQAEGNLASV